MNRESLLDIETSHPEVGPVPTGRNTPLSKLADGNRTFVESIFGSCAEIPIESDREISSFLPMRFSLTLRVGFIFCFALAMCQTDAAAVEGPNIVLILCDDLGYADVGFNGSEDITTPALDTLAKNGAVFTSAYVAHPFCGPSRMALMSGRYPHTFGAPFNLPNSGLGIEEYNQQGIPESETLISTVLRDAGYYTGAIGKWHMGIEPQFHPNKRGFEDFYGFLGGGHMYFPEKYGPIHERQSRAGKESINEYVVPLEHNGVAVKETEYMTDGLSREAVRFVKEAAGKKDPFFLYLAYNAPHTPLEAKEEDLAKFAEIKDEKRRAYAAMIYAVDRGVGNLVETLKATGAFDNTLIVFLSDNGGKIGAGANNAPLNQGKGSICEGGYRVPMFFHWPAKVLSGKRFDHPVTALDFYPTFARLAGAKIPRDKKLDGKDIWDAFQAGQNPRADETIFALRHWNGFHNVGVRRNKWKASKRGPKSAWQLFNLDEDIGESTDVSAKHPELIQQMMAEARKWSQSHTTPRWFDNKNAEDAWMEKSMPKYESTFSIEQRKGR
jgi:arylsulfatase B